MSITQKIVDLFVVKKLISISQSKIVDQSGRFKMFYFNYANYLYLSTVVRPRAEFHDARLLIERKVFHVDLAGRFVNGRWFPEYLAGILQRGFCHQRHLVIPVRAAETEDAGISVNKSSCNKRS